MNMIELQKYLNDKIPVTELLNFKIKNYSEENISIIADLKTNSNLHGTAFAGSISSILILTGWLRAFHFMQHIDSDAYIVLKSSSTNYIKPVKEDLTSHSPAISKEEKESFIEKYNRDGKNTIEIKSYLKDNQTDLASFKGIFYIRKKN